MKITLTTNKMKALLQACLSKPTTLCKTRREVVFETAKEQGFNEAEARLLAQRILTIWTAVDTLLDQCVESYGTTI